MNENKKTITYVAVGVVAILIGLLTLPSSAKLDENTLVGTDLASKFESPEAAKRLRIVRFDPDTAKTREFEVAEQNGLWTIPSKEGYPADAARQMAEASNSIMKKMVLKVVSNNAGDHEQYGVIDPKAPKLEPGQKGVGTRVTMSDAEGKPLADLIVGEPVRDAEKQRYVRVAGQDVVYIVEIDPSKFSTSFEDWIKKDLLDFHAFDMQQVLIKDYSAELVPVMTQDGPRYRPTWNPRAEMTLDYKDSGTPNWTANKLIGFDDNGGRLDVKLKPDEELNEESLNSLKSALGDLKIVDVVHKPQGLSDDLKAGQDFLKKENEDKLRELASKGFTAARTKEGGELELVSTYGEAIATMKNGAQYVLRFGNLTDVAGSGQDKEAKAQSKDATADAKNKKTEKGDKTDVHRYLFVMARFDKNAVKGPDLEKVPDLPAKADAKTDAKVGEVAAKKDVASGKKDDAAAKKDEKSNKKDDAAAKKDDSAAKKDDAAAKKKDEPAAKKKDEPPAKKDEAGAKKAEAAKNAPPSEKDLDKIIAERKRIEAENQRKIDEYQALLKKGPENVKELNLRFGDWYFVVNDDVFQKIRLSQDKVIKKKEKPKVEGATGTGNTGAPGGAIPGLPAIPGVNK
jgi:hypothetical protein